MGIWLKGYFLNLLFLGILDGIWLGFLSRPFYIKHLGFLMRDMVYWPTALAFYFSYAAGISFFVLIPFMEHRSLLYAFATGAFLGFISYMSYDFTNHATIKDFPLIVVFADIAWGVFVTGTTALLSAFFLKKYIL